MFGRRKSVIPKGRIKPIEKTPAPLGAKQSPVREPIRPVYYSQHVFPIIVQQEDYDRGGSDLVYALVRYVNLMMEDGLYDSTQLPPHAMQSYHADLYLAQVNNGGHSQFIGNLMGPHFDITIRNVRQALKSIGSVHFTKIFDDFLVWMNENPSLVSEQTGFGDIPEALNDLDKRFYGQANTPSLSDLNAKWIESWKDLRVVNANVYKTEMHKLFASNPHKDANDRIRAIRTINYELLESPKAKLNYVGFKSQTHVLVTDMRVGNNQMIEGKSVPVFPIDTSVGLLLGVFSEHWIGIFRPVKGDKPRSVHIVLNSEFETLASLIFKHKAPAALHLLMGKWNQKNDVLAMTPNVNKHGQLSVVLTTKHAKLFIVAFGDQGARFYDPDMRLISAISFQEILAHSASSI